MDKWIKETLREHKDLIEENKWEEFYEDIHEDSRGEITSVLLDAGINPLDYMSYMPDDFLYEASISRFTIPKNIVNISTGAFAGCESLTHVDVPESIKIIGSYAFFQCRGLTDFVIPDGVT